MRFKVYPKGTKNEESYWVLELTDDVLRVMDHADEVVGEWSGGDAISHVRTPSFWESRKAYGVRAGGQWVDFDMSARAREELQAFLDRAQVRKDPDAARTAVLFGLGTAAAGFALAAIALAVTLATTEDDGGPGVVWWGGMLVGTVLFVQGLYRAAGAGRLRRLAAEVRDRDGRRRADRGGEWDYRDADDNRASTTDDRGEP